ncbi:uncharacterized protein CTHT_0050460 [Thermochaetoides thermophila DSM 1495]|uniref:Thymidylate kinase n=1 Tax=Chaetomium thermophilum (strain DSM 1495 / CBS 144.50 / IMI 039719) TaxID=759272 RepID=G0SD18_CHATD|nr:hypothetical protein CTHT_0050460 [Thermochaetoides thermophila DSM 1495]EGS18448.1 hypothetical protein CTHT_0050460 [Thermochaetoides thermophila DSM 1495]
MPTLTRQPFAPVDGARLQSLTSIKNRQNAIPSSPAKRKVADVLDTDDSENVDPALFSKRAKGLSADSDLTKSFKPATFVLSRAPPRASLSSTKDVFDAHSAKSSFAQPRTILQPKFPAARSTLRSSLLSPLSSPSAALPGRSPPRSSKRPGIFSRQRTQHPSTPSTFRSAHLGVPFSLDAALKGTIPSYSGSLRNSTSTSGSVKNSKNLDFLLPPESRSSWTFEIYEDTPEQEMTNLLQHSTCTLDISSDEESEQRDKRERAEGRDKENIPPPDDVSQTPARSPRAVPSFLDGDDMVEKQRGPLAEMNAADFYAEGCDKTSIFIVPGDEEDPESVVDESDQAVPECQAEGGLNELPLPQGQPNDEPEDVVLSSASKSFKIWEGDDAEDEANPSAFVA